MRTVRAVRRRDWAADKGEEEEGDDENKADEQRRAKVSLPSINKAMTMAMVLPDFINNIDPFMDLSLLGMDKLLHPYTDIQKDLRRKNCQPNIFYFLKKIQSKIPHY